MNNVATVRSGAWHGDNEVMLTFPTGWEVEMLNPKDAPTGICRTNRDKTYF